MEELSKYKIIKATLSYSLNIYVNLSTSYLNATIFTTLCKKIVLSQQKPIIPCSPTFLLSVSLN